jgi:hypothetical protein
VNLDLDAGPSLDDLIAELQAERTDPRYDQTVRRFLDEVDGTVDLRQAGHVAGLRRWLNAWGCRIAYPDEFADPFAETIADWWPRWQGRFPTDGVELADLSDADLSAFAGAFAELAAGPAAVNRRGTVRRFGPTAASKAIWVLRPAAVAPWDYRIAATTTGGRRDAGGYEEHQRVLRRWARSLRAGHPGVDIPEAVGRPDSTVARVLDEWCYLSFTRGRRRSG